MSISPSPVRWARPLSLFALTLALGACDELADALLQGNSEDEAQSALASVELTSVEGGLALTVLSGIDLDEPDNLIAAIESSASLFSPTGCVEAVAVARTVTMLFSGCDGPHGLQGLNGTVVVVADTPTAQSVDVSITATDLAYGDARITLSSQVQYGAGLSQPPTLSIASGGGGTATNGKVITRTGTFVAEPRPDSCMTLNGVVTSTLGDSSIRLTSLTDYQRCAPACPTGTVTSSEAQDDGTAGSDTDLFSIALTMSGGTSATYVTSEGDLGRVTLNCAE
jgi:hypothetical protein